MPFVAIFEQIFVVFERFDIGRLNGHEHEHKAGTAHADQVGIVLGGQIIDVSAHCLDVLRHGQLALFRGFRVHCAIVSIQCNFAVNDDVFTIRQFDQIIGLLMPTLCIFEGALNFVVCVFHQAAYLQGTTQLGLPRHRVAVNHLSGQT